MRLLSRAPTRVGADTVTVAYRYSLGTPPTRDRHRHPTLHQLSWSPDGVLSAEVEGVHWTLPPSLALWVPAGLAHEIHAGNGPLECVDLKILPASTPVGWTEATPIAVSPLLRALLLHLADPGVEQPRRRRAEEVVFDECRAAAAPRIDLPMPTDPRAARIASSLIRHPADDRCLADWARHVQSSPRTVSRLFRNETGLGFEAWRTRARIAASLPHLATGHPVAAVARRVGYQNTSAFIDAFRVRLGRTPRRYLDQFEPTSSGSAAAQPIPAAGPEEPRHPTAF